MIYKFYPKKILISDLDKNKYEKVGFKYEVEEELIPGYRYKVEQEYGCTGAYPRHLYNPDKDGYVTIPDKSREIFELIGPDYIEIKDIEDLKNLVELFGPIDMDDGVIYLAEDC